MGYPTMPIISDQITQRCTEVLALAAVGVQLLPDMEPETPHRPTLSKPT